MTRSRINAPLVLIFALVQGMWMGAQLHALSGAHARPTAAVAGCGCGKTASSDAQMSSVQPACAVCATAALMQDTPAPIILLDAPVSFQPYAVPSLAEVCLTPALPLHPGRGPPSAA
jgi:hypothetical protein